MATVIRLARFGTKHAPKYRVTVADSRRYVTGKFIEVLGTYNPVPRGQEKKIDVDVEKLQFWIKKGAQPSDRVKYLIRQIEKSK